MNFFLFIIAFWKNLFDQPISIYGNFSELKLHNEIPEITRRMPTPSNQTPAIVGKNIYTVFQCKMSHYFCYFQEITTESSTILPKTTKPSFGISDISNSSDAEIMKGERVLLLILNETNFN